PTYPTPRSLTSFPTRRSSDLVLVEMDEDLPRPAIHGQVGEDHFRSGIVVPTVVWRELVRPHQRAVLRPAGQDAGVGVPVHATRQDRKSTRLNSSHQIISYAVF